MLAFMKSVALMPHLEASEPQVVAAYDGTGRCVSVRIPRREGAGQGRHCCSRLSRP